MNFRQKIFLKGFLNVYLKKVFPELKISEKKTFKCFLNCSEQPTAQLLHNHISCLTPGCKGIGDIYGLVRYIKPSFANSSDDDIAEYLAHILKVEFPEDGKELLKLYSQAGFALIPLSPNSKVPVKGSVKWEETNYKNINIWNDWLERGYNIGINLGVPSNVVAVDIDDDSTYKKLTEYAVSKGITLDQLLGDTLTQTTSRGKHFLYNYDPAFFKTLNKVLREDGYQMELRTTGAYIVVAPSAIEGEIRKWNDKKITSMPEELKKFFMEYYNRAPNNEASVDEDIQKCIDNEKLDVVDLTGQRNSTFIKTAGIFRKWMPLDTVSKVLNFLSNNWIDKPIPNHELRAIMGQVNKYNTYDKQELGKIVLERLDITKEASAFQIAKSLNLEQKDIEDVLHYLEKERLIISVGKNRYKKLQKVQWETDFNTISEPVDFEVPYFHDYAYFDKGNMIIIGGRSGKGKTHITANIIRKLIEQGIHPYLVSTEAGSKIGKIVKELGIKVGQFSYKIVKSPHDIELEKNAVTIIDWLKPQDGDFSKTDATFERLNDQLIRNGGFLIVFVQIRKDGTFFAPDQIDFYASLVATYNYRKNGETIDQQNTYFETSKIRDSRTGAQTITIPTFFNPGTKLLELKNEK